MPDLAPPSGFLQRLDEKIARQQRGWQRILDWLILRPLPVPARASVFVLIITVGAIGLLNGHRWTQQEKSSPSVMIANEHPAPARKLGYLGEAQETKQNEQPELDQEELDSLKSLGYLDGDSKANLFESGSQDN